MCLKPEQELRRQGCRARKAALDPLRAGEPEHENI